MEFTIPCAVVARLSKILSVMTYDGNEWFNSIRIQDGMAIVSNRSIMAVEQIGGPSGTVHLVNDPALVEQCVKEAPFDSTLHIAVNELLRFATCKTTLGYIHPTNCAVWSNAPNELDRWREIIPSTPAKKPKGGMFWNAEQVALLAASSPSGRVIFEENIDISRATIIRDSTDESWFGLFLPHLTGVDYPPAKLPEWFK